jgi:hypothetical protein
VRLDQATTGAAFRDTDWPDPAIPDAAGLGSGAFGDTAGPGASLSVMLDTPGLAPGGRVVVTMIVKNQSPLAFHYPSGHDPACHYSGDAWFDFSSPNLDMGQDWPGDRGSLKGTLLDRYPGSLQLGRKDGPGCDATGPPAVLPPGATVQVAQA